MLSAGLSCQFVITNWSTGNVLGQVPIKLNIDSAAKCDHKLEIIPNLSEDEPESHPMAEPHVSSYYAASVNDTTRYPPLEGTVKADVCVIGGGFSGISTALSLAEKGRSVVVLESNRIGWGASGRNGGQCIAGISGEEEIERQLGADGAKLVRDIRYRGHEIIQERIAKYAIECDWKDGWMEAAARPRHMDTIRKFYEERVAEGEGDHHELIEPGNFRSVLDTGLYHGGIIDRRSGHLHPLNLCLGEARAARSLGVAIHEESQVLEMQGGTKPFVRTARGRVEADQIVLGGDTSHNFERGRLWGLQFPTGSYVIATEPLSDNLARQINPQDLAVCDSNVVLDYFRLSGDRRMLFGGRCNYSNRDPGDITGTMHKRLTEIFPQLKDVRVDYTWAGRIGIVLNRVPAIGRLEPNVYFMQGYCGHGVNATHIAGEIVADAICGTTEKFDMFDRIRHTRLPIGRWAGNQMLALGMLYYRLRDIM
jgi:gamma-glutamylputrescine oxidase